MFASIHACLYICMYGCVQQYGSSFVRACVRVRVCGCLCAYDTCDLAYLPDQNPPLPSPPRRLSAVPSFFLGFFSVFFSVLRVKTGVFVCVCVKSGDSAGTDVAVTQSLNICLSSSSPSLRLL